MMNPHDSQLPPGRLPRLTDPQRYQGLYIVDFGDAVCVGYLAGEVTTLVESGQFPAMRVFRIHRAMPDGTLDLVVVSPGRFSRQAEEGMVFLRQYEAAAREDYETLKNYAPGRFPCAGRVQLTELAEGEYPFATTLTYPAEYGEQVSRWLLEINYRGGDTIDFGSHKLTSFYRMKPRIVEEAAITPAEQAVARPLQDLLSARQYAVQR